MIDRTLAAIIKNLNDDLKSILNTENAPVILTNLVEQSGSTPVGTENKIVCTVVSLVQEKLYSEHPTFNRSVDQNPAINLNLYLLFSANYNSQNYTDGLRILSAVIGFFQNKKLFVPANTPNLPQQVEKLTLEIHNLELNELSHFWGAIGAKYMPSVIYKMRMISITQNRIKQIVPDVKRVQNDLGLS